LYNGRKVFFYDAVKNGCPEPEAKKPRGHFERLEINTNKYIFVDNDRPSGIKNSYVVSEKEATNGLGLDGAKMVEIGTTSPFY